MADCTEAFASLPESAELKREEASTRRKKHPSGKTSKKHEYSEVSVRVSVQVQLCTQACARAVALVVACRCVEACVSIGGARTCRY